MEITLTKSPQANMLDLVNISSDIALELTDITFGVPQEYTDETGGNPRNTQVEVTAGDASDFSGSTTVRYTRLDLEVIRDNLVLEYTKYDDTTLDDIFTGVVESLGVMESQVTLSVDAVPDIPESDTHVTIQILAIDDSLLYIGQTDIKLLPAKSPLSELLTSKDLDGFNYPS